VLDSLCKQTQRREKMTVPTQQGFDWSTITGHAVERLRAPKTTPVPDAIVALAQRSWDGVPNHKNPDGEKLHVLRHSFESEERAVEFAKHMRKAGAFTLPMTSVSVVVDPDGTGDVRTIAWRAGTRRGKAAS
jgi:hypothetical protein